MSLQLDDAFSGDSLLQEDPGIPGENEPITNADENANTEISDEELALLDATEDGEEDGELRAATLDDSDEDGEKLNEAIDVSGEDLDVPGSEDDDANEALGEEDEENNSYSHRGDQDDTPDEE